MASLEMPHHIIVTPNDKNILPGNLALISEDEHFSKRSQLMPIKTAPPCLKGAKAYADFPPTPPDDMPVPNPSAKRTVSFRLPELPNGGYFDEEDEFSAQTPDCVSDDDDDDDDTLALGCVEVSSDILVALMNRDKDMRELAVRNKSFFDLVRQSLVKGHSWEAFVKVLYTPREELPDVLWMKGLTQYLEPNPSLLKKFKDIVGYIDVDVHKDDEDDDDDDDDDDNYFFNGGGELVDITTIRDYPERLEALEKSYPQFFITMYKALNKVHDLGDVHPQRIIQDNTGAYAEFKKLLYASRDEIDDDNWEMDMYDTLDPWPKLIAQFEQIVAYEAQDDEDYDGRDGC